MKKIMFNDKYGLTQSVLEGRKTMTRRVIKLPDGTEGIYDWTRSDFPAPLISIRTKDGELHDRFPAYQVGEVVAVAQRYQDIPMDVMMQRRTDGKTDRWPFESLLRQSHGCSNKQGVVASLMPHHIRITDIKVERLQDISDEDCLREGIIPVTWRQWHKQEPDDFTPQRYTDHDVWTLEKFREGILDPWAESDPNEYMAETAQVAFAALIDRISGKGTWDSNPWVWVYQFKKYQEQ